VIAASAISLQCRSLTNIGQGKLLIKVAANFGGHVTTVILCRQGILQGVLARLPRDETMRMRLCEAAAML
jgi:hypothetical protein